MPSHTTMVMGVPENAWFNLQSLRHVHATRNLYYIL